MASASTHNESCYKITSSPGFKKTVFLEDWWLIKAEKDIEGMRLAVAGFTCRDTHQPRRLFSSAPILKIHDVFTLETTDGICVILEGFINKAHTKENGFTSDVFDYFVFGFPPYWVEYAEKCMGEGFASNAVSTGASTSPQVYEMAAEKVRNVDSNKKDMGVEECEDIVKENEQHRSDCTESSVEELGVYFEFGVSTVDVEGTNKNVETSNTSELPENFLDNTPRQPIDDMATGLTTGLSGLEGKAVTPSIVATYSNITPKKESRRQSKRNHKLKSLSGHMKENAASNCNIVENNSALEDLEKENLNNKSSISPVGFGKEKVVSAKISIHSSPFDAGLQDPMDERTVINPDTEQSTKSSGGANGKKDKNCEQKASISEEASTTRKKTKRKLKYGSPAAPVTRRGTERASILSPESLSSKRSRSGRLLLPTLEFWRNQTVIYDEDRRVTGIKQDLPAVQSSRGSKSEPKRKLTKLA
ncbi:hypothetical protein LguiB_015656 [Lonicera macranthoides]